MKREVSSDSFVNDHLERITMSQGLVERLDSDSRRSGLTILHWFEKPTHGFVFPIRPDTVVGFGLFIDGPNTPGRSSGAKGSFTPVELSVIHNPDVLITPSTATSPTIPNASPRGHRLPAYRGVFFF